MRVGCLFGGAHIVVPDGVRVTTKQAAIFGGVEVDVRDDELPDDAPLLEIEALAVFGGVKISRESQA